MNNDFAEIPVPEEVKGRMEESPEVLKARYEEYFPVPAPSGKPDRVTLSAPAFNFRESIDGLNKKLSDIEALSKISSDILEKAVQFYLYVVDEVLDYMLKNSSGEIKGIEIKGILPLINEMAGKIKNIINRSELSADGKKGKLAILRGFFTDYINKLRASGIFTDDAELHELIPNFAGGKRRRKTRKVRKVRKVRKSKRRRGNKKQKK
jgi:hypothetical protein